MTSEFAFSHWRPGFDERLIIRNHPPFASVGDTDWIRHQDGGVRECELHVTSSLQLSSLDSLAWAARSISALIAPPMRNANPVTYSQINRIITSATDP